jgi:hypothetical protein
MKSDEVFSIINNLVKESDSYENFLEKSIKLERQRHELIINE